MGWCSGTNIFDAVLDGFLNDSDEIDKKDLIKKLIIALENNDWDCQGDSAYYDHPLVKEIFKELHPRWFDGE